MVEQVSRLPASPESFRASLERLISKFEGDKEHYLAKGYPEAQARIDFITPLFKALGWDFENEAASPHSERDVVVEQREAEASGYPDYSFRVGGRTKFFVEAKAPSQTPDDTRHILQVKGYAWSTKSVFFVVLTNFEEFRFYDASIKPDERKPDEGLLFKLRYTNYLDNLGKLWEFSRDRVVAGSLDAMLPRDRRTERLRIPVDEAFLNEMTGWREELARDIYKNNHGLTARQLNEVVQRLLDRIVFIRIAEDRRIIERFQLRDAAEQWRARGGKFEIFDWLHPLFEKINDDFNGEIFKPNELLEKTQVDSAILAHIIERLYPPKSPYFFGVIGVELLGSIYERYLGKTIRPTARTVRVEEKPEVRKAGGVYYTPQYIVDYIVKNTVGKAFEGKTPKQIEKIRILDPACGSGSFLIGAFQCLIDYHVQWYLAHPEREVRHAHPSLDFMREVHADADGGHRLSVYRKAKILRNNLFGVDIDPQAVEITMMSLYLKALEGEKSQLPAKQHLLPELKYNIICGNSLIGPDIYKDVQLGLFGEAERERINAFDWNSEVTGFGQIMQQGGFDCVMGNPPWVSLSGKFGNLIYPRSALEYMISRFHGNTYMPNLYEYFVAQGLNIARTGGLFSLIVPDRLGFNDQFVALRRRILEESKVISLVYKTPFPGITADTLIFVFQKGKAGITHPVSLSEYGKPEIVRPQRELASDSHQKFEYFEDVRTMEVVAKIASTSKAKPVREICSSTSGFGGKSALIQRDKTSRSQVPTLKGDSIGRYEIRGSYWFDFRKSNITGRTTDPEKLGASPKILLRKTGDRIIATLDDSGIFPEQSLYFLYDNQTEMDFKFLLGLLNSRLLTFYLRAKALTNKKSIAQVKKVDLDGLPLYLTDFAVATDRARHDNVVALVDCMLELTKSKRSGKLAPSELERVEREIAATDAEIDNLVYELYGITDEEQPIIEGKTVTVPVTNETGS